MVKTPYYIIIVLGCRPEAEDFCLDNNYGISLSMGPQEQQNNALPNKLIATPVTMRSNSNFTSSPPLPPSPPSGELFDHGLDSLAAILLPLCLYSALGRGHEWGGNPHGFIVPCIAVLAGFYLFHWEKYITGVLYLPWLFDATQLVRGGQYSPLAVTSSMNVRLCIYIRRPCVRSFK